MRVSSELAASKICGKRADFFCFSRHLHKCRSLPSVSGMEKFPNPETKRRLHLGFSPRQRYVCDLLRNGSVKLVKIIKYSLWPKSSNSWPSWHFEIMSNAQSEVLEHVSSSESFIWNMQCHPMLLFHAIFPALMLDPYLQDKNQNVRRTRVRTHKIIVLTFPFNWLILAKFLRSFFLASVACSSHEKNSHAFIISLVAFIGNFRCLSPFSRGEANK